MSFDTEIEMFKSQIVKTGQEVAAEIKRLDQKIEDYATETAQKSGGITSMPVGSGKGFAANAAKEISDNIQQLDKHGSLRLEVKAAADLVTTAQTGNTQNIGAGAPTGVPMGLQYACQNIQMIGASSIEYSRYQGMEGATEVQAAEGDVKAALRGSWLLVNQPSITVAGYSNISRQALHDSTQLKAAIQSVMGMSLNRSIDALLWNGSVGLFGGFDSLADTHTSTEFVSLPDAVAEAVAAVQEAGCNPTHVVLSPTSWVNITTAKAEGSGEYLTGNYMGMVQPMLHGLPVVLSLSVPSGQAVLVDANNVELAITQNPTIEIGYSGDGFIRNQAVLLIETRIAPVVKATAGLTLVIPATPAP